MNFPSRPGIQLLELTISLTTASILMAGITGSILIANRASEMARSRQSGSLRNTAGIDRLRSDFAQAYPVTNRTATSATLSVSDRNGDSVRETVQYRWNGANSPLQMSVNANAWQNVSDNLDSFALNWRSSEPQVVQTIPTALESAPSLVFQSRTFANTSLATKSLTLDVPATHWPGDLLVAAIAVSGNQSGTITAPSGWIKIQEKNQNSFFSLSDISLASWYCTAPPAMQTTINWNISKLAYATMAHFRVQGGSPSLASATDFSSLGQPATAPSAAANVNGSLVVRVLAVDALMFGTVDTEATNMPGHAAITMRRQGLSPIIGMAYRLYPSGTVPSANFGLTGSANYASATMVFSP